MLIKVHQTQYSIGDFESTKQHLLAALKTPAKETTVHIFPELFISGYPLQDLCLDISFINKVQKFYQEVNEELLNTPKIKISLFLVDLTTNSMKEISPIKYITAYLSPKPV